VILAVCIRTSASYPRQRKPSCEHFKGIGRQWVQTERQLSASPTISAYLYMVEGRLAEAEKVFQQSLQEKRETLGPDDIETCHALTGLGTVYLAQGRLAEAEDIYRQALQGHEKDPTILLAIGNLGLVYMQQGNETGAERMLRQALEGQQKLLGVDHHATIDIINNLAFLARNQGKLDEAEALCIQALQGFFEKGLGADSPATLNAVENLAEIYTEMGRLDDSKRTYLRALDGFEALYGRSNARCQGILKALADMGNGQGDDV
jgi:tetratricopeptide (TPR) repeat protein